jgi:hypothetical protein
MLVLLPFPLRAPVPASDLSSSAGLMLQDPLCGKHIKDVRGGAVDYVFGLIEIIREVRLCSKICGQEWA